MRRFGMRTGARPVILEPHDAREPRVSLTSDAAPAPWQSESRPADRRPPLASGHRTLGRVLTALLAGCVGVSVLKVLLDLYGISLFGRWAADPASIVIAKGESFDLLYLGLVGLGLFLNLATGIATITWLYQAYGSREADPALLPHARWWTIGGWLIPVIWLVRPFELMRNLYRATVGAQPQEQPGASMRYPALFRWWWGCWLVGNLLASIALGSAADHPDFGQLRTAVSLDLVIEVIMIAAAGLFVAVLRSITSNLWRRDNEGEPFPPENRVRSEREVQ